MPDIASSDVTVTILETLGKLPRGIRRRVSIAYGNGTLTYPTGGVPMPAASAFGFAVAMQPMNIIDDDDAQGIFHKYDAANNKVRHWFPTQQTGGAGNRAGVEYTGGTTAVPATTIYAFVEGY